MGHETTLVHLLSGATARGVEFEPAFCEYAQAARPRCGSRRSSLSAKYRAPLHGLLTKIRDLELPLIAVVPGSEPESDAGEMRGHVVEVRRSATHS